MASFLRYFGGKYYLAPWIVEHMPLHRSYVEVFGGAGHVLFVKDKVHHEVFNDKDDILVDTFEVIRDDEERFIEAIRWYPYSLTLRRRLLAEGIPSEKFERALWYFYLNRSAFSGLWLRSEGFARARIVSVASGYRKAIESLEYFSDRLSEVILEHLDYRDVFAMYDAKDTFFYCDPPYHGNEKAYRVNFIHRDHARLALLLKKIQGKVMISYVDHPWVRRWYSGWNFVVREFNQYTQKRAAGQKDTRIELLVMNY